RALFPDVGPDEIVIINELVTIADEEIGGGFLDANTNHGLGILAQFADKRGEIRITTDDDKSVDVALGITKVERVDDHADIGGVLARLAHMRDLDQFKRGFV